MRLLDVLLARRRIAPYVRRTPLVRSSWLSDLSGADVRLKLESAHDHLRALNPHIEIVTYETRLSSANALDSAGQNP